MNHAVAKTAFCQQFKSQADIVGEGLFAASYYDGHEKQVALVNQSGSERMGGEIGTTYEYVMFSRCL